MLAVVGEKKKVEEIKLRLTEVIDPEIGINIVDLGLVRKIDLEEKNFVKLDVTLTSVACPLTEYIEESIISALEEYKIGITWVWDPPWTPEEISESGKEYLGSLGIEI